MVEVSQELLDGLIEQNKKLIEILKRQEEHTERTEQSLKKIEEPPEEQKEEQEKPTIFKEPEELDLGQIKRKEVKKPQTQQEPKERLAFPTEQSKKITSFEKEMAGKPREQVFYKEKGKSKQQQVLQQQAQRIHKQREMETDRRAQELQQHAKIQPQHIPQRPIQPKRRQMPPPRQPYREAPIRPQMPTESKGFFGRLWDIKFQLLLIIIIAALLLLLYTGNLQFV